MTKEPVTYGSLRKKRGLLREMLPLPMPISMQIEPTSYCNFNCLYCARSLPEYRQYVEKDIHFDLVLFERIIKQISTYGRLKSLRLYYIGEPFLHPQILEIISLAIKSNVAERIEITSNGSVMNSKHVEGICSIAKDMDVSLYLRFSIYSVIPENHLRVTNSKINIENIYHNIEYLKKRRDESGTNNVFVYAKMIDTYSEENNIFLKRYSNITDEAAIEPPMNWSGFDNINSLSSVYECPDYLQSGHTILSHRKVCAYPFYSLCIYSDGSVVACCVDWNRKTLLGNVKQQTLYEIWNGPAANQLRKLHLRGERTRNEACRNCEILHSLPVEDNLDFLSVEEWDKLNLIERGVRV
jgi:radical SAM protein with 4Fe4S-binding SPASM domain